MSKVTDPELSRTSIPPSTTSSSLSDLGVEDLSANRTGRRIRVRWAPSPTGIPHVGNIRTALYNYLFTKSQKGDFLLRIEDTDQKRLVAESLPKIKESLEVLGIKWDEYYVQSERLEIYAKHLEKLKKEGTVYEDEGAWRFRVEKGKKIKWNDLVHGEIEFSSDVIEDFIIIKSDQFPTYHFASVIDDTEMNISHVLRGDEWLSSTPKHLMLYEALGWEPPRFLHLPPILGADHKKLSKREGAKSVMEYIKEGYLPEALVNFMAFLGWAPKDEREIFSLEDLIREFSIERINKNSPIFNLEKLAWFNNQWLKKLEPKTFYEYLNKEFDNAYASNVTLKIAPLVQSRLTTLNDFPTLAGGFYKDPTLKKDVINSVPVSGAIISSYENKLSSINNWTPENIRAGTVDFAAENKVETKDLYRSLGIATFGNLVTPPLPESVSILGKDVTSERLKKLAKQKK